MKHLLGIDIGTTSIKGCVFDETGRRLDSHAVAYELLTEGGTVELPAERYYELFREVFDTLRARVRIDAFSIDTQGETILFCDKDGTPLMNAIVWLDTRADEEAREIEAHFGKRAVYEHTGQPEVPAGYPASKILWLKRHRPELFARTEKIMLLEDYLLYRLTGRFVSDRSLWSSSLCLDVVTGEYWPEMLALIGVGEAQLPHLLESGVLVGEVEGIPLSTGALDQVSGFLGSGTPKAGRVTEMTGTCLAVSVFSESLPPYSEERPVPAYYIGKNQYCLLLWAPTAGMALEWVRKNFCGGADFKTLDHEAEAVPFGSEGVTFLPHLEGSVLPENDPSMKGVIFGLSLSHTRAHLVRATMEAVACLVRQYTELVDGSKGGEIRSIGGAAKSPLWGKIKASVTGRTVKTLEESETGCLGTAILAGVGAGIYPDFCVADRLLREKNTYLPQLEKTEADALYHRFLTLYQLALNRPKNL